MRECWDSSAKILFLNKNRARSPLLWSPPVKQDSRWVAISKAYPHLPDKGSSQQLSLAQAGRPQVQDPDLHPSQAPPTL